MITVLGAGNFGTTLANIVAGKGYQTKIWTIEEDVYQDVKENSCNQKYLPGVELADKIEIYMELEEALSSTEIIIVGVPSHVVREVIKKTVPIIKDTHQRILLDIAKGLEPETFLRMSEVIQEELAHDGCQQHKLVALSGPSIANELSQGVHTAVMVASEEIEYARRIKDVFETKRLKLILSQDIVGLELGGVFKNIVALLMGICDGAGLGVNTRAALMVAIYEEISRLSVALGAERETLYGLPGLGDMIATSMSPSSRNRTLGKMIGEGKTLSQARDEMHMVAEGVSALRVACQVAEDYELEVPLIRKEYELLFEGASIHDLVAYYYSLA